MKRYRIVSKVCGESKAEDSRLIIAKFGTKEEASASFRHYAEEFLNSSLTYNKEKVRQIVKRFMDSKPNDLNICVYAEDRMLSINVEEYEETITVRVSYRSEVYITGTKDEIRQKWGELDLSGIVDESRLPLGVSTPEFVEFICAENADTCEDFDLD